MTYIISNWKIFSHIPIYTEWPIKNGHVSLTSIAGRSTRTRLIYTNHDLHEHAMCQRSFRSLLIVLRSHVGSLLSFGLLKTYF